MKKATAHGTLMCTHLLSEPLDFALQSALDYFSKINNLRFARIVPSYNHMILSIHQSVCTLSVQLNIHHSMYLTRSHRVCYRKWYVRYALKFSSFFFTESDRSVLVLIHLLVGHTRCKHN